MKTNIYLLLLAAFFNFNLRAQLSGYNFIKPVTVSNTSTTNAINYQMKLVINTQSLIAAAQMQSGGQDLRFGKTCNGSTLFNYWIESGINTASTVIWVKIDSIPAGSNRTIFMFYGNSSASAVSAIPGVFVGPHSSTDSVANTSLSGAADSQRGFRFQPNEDLLTTHFGKNEPNGTTRYITLFDFATQAIITQTQVSGPATTYSYGPISNPIWLMQGTQYLLEIFQSSTDGYYFGASPQVGQHLTFLDMRYCKSCTPNTFPTNSLGGMHYGYVDLWYWTKNTITPTPSYTIDAGPVQSVSPSAASICSGSSVTLTAMSTLVQPSFTWMPGNITGASIVVSPSSTTNYSLIIGSNGCSYTLNAASTVTVNQTPVVSVTGSTLICGTGTTVLNASGANTYLWSNGSTNASIAVSPTISSNYTVSGTSNGCTSSVVTVITVTTNPTISIAATSQTICSGNTTSISASGAATYSWNTGSNSSTLTASPTVSSTYSVIGASIEGCTETASINISVNPAPSVLAVSSTSLLCSGQSATLSASGANTYSWNTGSLQGNIVVSPTVTTIYTVTGTNTVTGCSSNATITQTVSTCAGILNTMVQPTNIKVYPNPTFGLLTVEVNEETQISVYNAVGMLVKTETINSPSEINITTAPVGIYFMTLKNASGSLTIKLIKE